MHILRFSSVKPIDLDPDLNRVAIDLLTSKWHWQLQLPWETGVPNISFVWSSIPVLRQLRA